MYLRGDGVQRQKIVVLQLRLVFRQFHLLDPPIDPHPWRFNIFQLIIFRRGFIVDVDVCQRLACGGKSPKVFSERDMWQIALQVHLVFLAIGGVMQETVIIVEDVPLGEGVVAIVGSEFRQRPIGDVLLSVRAVLVVGVEREALRIACNMDIWNYINHQCMKG